MLDIVFDGNLRTRAFHDPASGEVQLVTLGVDDEGFGVELGEDAYLAVDGDDAFAHLALRGPMGDLTLAPSDEAALAAPDTLPEADLAEASWPMGPEQAAEADGPVEGAEGAATTPSVVWRLDGARLVVLVPGTVRSQWARIGTSGLCVALDLERAEGEALVAALVHLDVTRDPGFAALTALMAEG
ncbi:MAG: hypothetical protein R3F49_13720 [Planctomycetota bacterium]